MKYRNIKTAEINWNIELAILNPEDLSTIIPNEDVTIPTSISGNSLNVFISSCL